jgi:glycosyltransferase involved in cell wall biosynthesis
VRHRLAIDGHVLTGKSQGSRTVLACLVQALHEESLADGIVLFSDDPAELAAAYPAVEHRKLPSASPIRRLLVDFPRLLKGARVQSALFTYIAPPFSRVSMIVFMHDVLPLTHPHFFPRLFTLRFGFFTFLTLLQSRCVLTISEASAAAIRRLYPFAAKKVNVLPLGPSFEEMAYRPARPDPAGRPYILAVGRIERRKNMKLLTDAFLAADLHDVDLVIVGTTHMGYQWDVPEDPRVRRLSNLSDADLIEVYRGASLFVYPSSAEGFGLPLLDATLFGLPIVSSNLTSMPEVAGALATYFDPEAEDAVETLSGLIFGHFRDRPIAGGSVLDIKEQFDKFSWRSLARRFARIVDGSQAPGRLAAS